MLLLSAFAFGFVASLNTTVTEDIFNQSSTDASTTEMLAEPTKVTPTSMDFTNVTLLDKSFWNFQLPQCHKFRPVNHIFFQVANVLFLTSCLAPHTNAGLLWLRASLTVACGLHAAWAFLVECYLDMVLWNLVFMLVNFVYFVVHIHLIRPIKFHKEIEDAYVALFRPLKVSRRQFRRVLACMRCVRTLKCHELYAHENITKLDSLSLVLSGKLVISQNQRALHIVFPHHFLDSPEWFGVSTDEFFQVSIMAMEECRVLVWHRDKLRLSIMSDGFLQAVFDHILGRDVVHKLMQVSETMGVGNGHVTVPIGGCEEGEEGEDKPMLVVKKAGDGPGITAILNRQLLATRMSRSRKYHYIRGTDPNAWRLGRIEETDLETPV